MELLPLELIVEIFSYVPVRDLFRNLRLVCKDWREFVDLSFDLMRSVDLTSCAFCIKNAVHNFGAKLHDLRVLFLDRCIQIKDIEFELLVAKSKKIEVLSLNGCSQLGDGAVAVINGMQHVYRLSLSETNANLYKVLPMPTLKYLTMKKCKYFSKGNVSDAISKMPQLLSLDLIETRDINDADLTTFSVALTALKALNISRCDKITNTGVKKLGALKNLEELDLSWTGIGDAAVEDLATLKNLRVIKLDSNFDVTDKSIIKLATNCPLLEEITLTDCFRITDASLMALMVNCRLKVASLRGTDKITREKVSKYPECKFIL